jgi:hypothetical protein
MVDNSVNWPINYSIARHTNQKSNDFQQNMSKGIPCHITKIDKDMVTVAFDAQNGTWTVPTMKMPQAFGPNARDAPQVGDHGYASPSDYYLGGNSGLGGGTADFGPRGNLTALVFHPLSRTSNQQRDNNQYTVTGGKTGIKMWQGPAPSQQSQQQQNPNSSTSTANTGSSGAQPARRIPFQNSERYSLGIRKAAYGKVRSAHWRPGGFVAARAAPQPRDGTTGSTTGTGSTSNGSASQQSSSAPSGTSLTIDNNGAYTLDGTNKYRMSVDNKNKKATVEAPVAGQIFIGGPGQQSNLYSVVLTAMGPAVNSQAKIVKTDETVQQSSSSGSSGS